jgi:hypothetical protein
MLALALTVCLSLDGVELPPLTLTSPPIRATTEAGERIIFLPPADALRLARELESRGYGLDQIVAALRPLRLRSGRTTEALKCGECQDGAMVMRPEPRCVAGKIGQSCTSCKVCGDPEPEPIACGEPPADVRIIQ